MFLSHQITGLFCFQWTIKRAKIIFLLHSQKLLRGHRQKFCDFPVNFRFQFVYSACTGPIVKYVRQIPCNYLFEYQDPKGSHAIIVVKNVHDK